jgi:hypothetical protein
MNWKVLDSFRRGWIERGFKALIDRKLREGRQEERRLAERRGTKHRFEAIKSCIADARTYRVARRLSALGRAQFN